MREGRFWGGVEVYDGGRLYRQLLKLMMMGGIANMRSTSELVSYLGHLH